MFINLTCNIDIKINVSCDNTPLWLQCESNYFLVSKQEASWIIILKDRYRFWYKLIVSVGQIHENTDWAVSGLILATGFVWTLSSWLSCTWIDTGLKAVLGVGHFYIHVPACLMVLSRINLFLIKNNYFSFNIHLSLKNI